ncbi:hypothetical protein GCM10007972_07030 [Iodidimonas muriae]|uniref:Uncharacterized protein n=1 Tax=Iodidimonas muriae TaxID=261467 RepID=A0ABQ2L9H3_9PROT|nr:hypothetical protein JCM17843_02560 [Kordiimonadales bacterium JCM 17843]GGO07539.1 hypothetical protein GCM10007972_07030 [Iodidimonas muriae]
MIVKADTGGNLRPAFAIKAKGNGDICFLGFTLDTGTAHGPNPSNGIFGTVLAIAATKAKAKRHDHAPVEPIIPAPSSCD